MTAFDKKLRFLNSIIDKPFMLQNDQHFAFFAPLRDELSRLNGYSVFSTIPRKRNGEKYRNLLSRIKGFEIPAFQRLPCGRR